MASMVVRNISEATKKAIRLRAAENGKSMEAEVRDVLDAVYGQRAHVPDIMQEPRRDSWVDRVVRRFQEVGGVELHMPSRGEMPEPITFSEAGKSE